ncbi:hypothetical protein AKJ09_05643 [Labilithrix luteola]|uniref:Uncharacterized protein n=1 Tax=Labilithrix luteola TaxID=1391654 RepID=A0A0K1Q0P0_9BACT|nr:hypothetical protein [Labilithrix luteola]AKU98979.1 hypothetical protein AKJ09_05643 [Labilithrix luteola]
MKPTNRIPRLGVDIGRVIIHGDGPDTSFIQARDDETAMRAPAVDGAIDALARLTLRFDGAVWLVSKCGPRIEGLSRRWLAHHGFFERTGISPAQLRFCRERREKAGICLKLGVTMFVDDRLDVLLPMAGVVEHRFLFGVHASSDPTVTPVPTWRATEAAIEAILDEVDRGVPLAPAGHHAQRARP